MCTWYDGQFNSGFPNDIPHAPIGTVVGYGMLPIDTIPPPSITLQ
jgi:hypothetical protein